jgi:hypothetical protein
MLKETMVKKTRGEASKTEMSKTYRRSYKLTYLFSHLIQGVVVP